MKLFLLSCLVIGSGLLMAQTHHSAHAETPAGDSPTSALDKLVKGNMRFAQGEPAGEHLGADRRKAVAAVQAPFAVIVTCSDSRLTPEFIFDQGIGDLFVVRVAGNTLDDVALGSIEYAVEHLGSNLIVVMGHERCGAVSAALKGGKLPGKLPAVVAPIKPACEHAEGDYALDLAVRRNVENMVSLLAERNPVTKKLRDQRELRVVGMKYDLDSGEAAMTLML
jgi:carbonic anhydrase